jgi:hypothetical protein
MSRAARRRVGEGPPADPRRALLGLADELADVSAADVLDVQLPELVGELGQVVGGLAEGVGVGAAQGVLDVAGAGVVHRHE